MSHTFKTDDTVFISNQGIDSSEVTIRVKNKSGKGYTSISVEQNDLFAFVAHKVRQDRIGALEQMEDWEILGMQTSRA